MYYLKMKIYLSILLFFLNGLLLAQTDIYPFRKGDVWYYTDKNFNKISNEIYEEAFPFLYDYAVVKINGKYGFVDKKENLIIPAMYDSAFIQPRGGLEVKLKNEKFLIDLNNKRLPVVVGCGNNGSGSIGWPYRYTIYQEGNKYGVYLSCNTFIPPIYDSISLINYSFILTVVNSDGKYGVYSTRSESMTYPVILDSIEIVRQPRGHILEHLLIYQNDRMGAVGFIGQLLAFPKYKNLHFDYYYAPHTILENGKKGYIIDGVEYWMK